MSEVERACAATGLDCRDRTRLPGRANTVYLLPHENAVMRLRLTRQSQEWHRRLAVSVQVTRWLRTAHGFPTVVPLEIDQPIIIGDWTATVWRHEAVQERADPATVTDLANLLRRLHAMISPVDLPQTDPLGSLPTDIDHSRHLRADQYAWMAAQIQAIKERYPDTPMPLGQSMIHGDAHTGNLLLTGRGCLFADWDSVSCGPRVQDLIPTLHRVRHFGHPYGEWVTLCAAYGVHPGIDQHNGVRLLQRARELRSLAAYMRDATRTDVRTELDHRLRTLMIGDPAHPGRWSKPPR